MCGQIRDVTGALMQADMDDLVHVHFTEDMVDILLEIDKRIYGPCVTIKSNRKCSKTLSKAPCLVALNMYLALHLLLFG